MIESLGKTEKVVLALLANNLFGAELSIPDDVDWEAVYKECQQQTVLVHTYMSAKESGKVPDHILRDWEKKVISASAYHFQNFYTHHSVDSMMKEDSIPYVILKGCASARYYPKPIERQMGDVDFLVEKPHIAVAEPGPEAVPEEEVAQRAEAVVDRNGDNFGLFLGDEGKNGAVVAGTGLESAAVDIDDDRHQPFRLFGRDDDV